VEYEMTRPCPTCPFRSDGKAATAITPAQVDQLELHLTMSEHACLNEATDGDQHCAGALILLEKLEQPHQMMLISERLGLYDPNDLDLEAPVFDSWEDMREHMEDVEAAPRTEEICPRCDNWAEQCTCPKARKVPPPPPPRRKVPPPPPRKR